MCLLIHARISLRKIAPMYGMLLHIMVNLMCPNGACTCWRIGLDDLLSTIWHKRKPCANVAVQLTGAHLYLDIALVGLLLSWSWECYVHEHRSDVQSLVLQKGNRHHNGTWRQLSIWIPHHCVENNTGKAALPQLSMQSSPSIIIMTSWASYKIRKTASCTCAVNVGNVFPATAG